MTVGVYMLWDNMAWTPCCFMVGNHNNHRNDNVLCMGNNNNYRLYE